jgi:dipeptidyl-peptidase-4
MARLGVERVFSDPPVAVTLPVSLAINRDGTIVTWLEPGSDDRDRLDLWRYDTATGMRRLWLDGRSVDPDDFDALSPKERADRERRRQFAHGITSYQWSADGRLIVVPAAGVVHVLDVASGALERVSPTGRHTDVRISPCGRYLSYVRERSLFVLELATRTEQPIARSSDPLITFGVADFIAQEEMHRYRGHWWSADGSRIAFTRVDERPVSVSHRHEIGAGTIEVVEQRYPFAGEANVAVALGVFDLGQRTTCWLDWARAPDDYLARVDYTPDGVVVQVQNRAQTRLEIRCLDPAGASAATLATETAATWINHSDTQTPITPRGYLLSIDDEEGSALWRIDGQGRARLTGGPGRVNRIVHADETSALVLGWDDVPTEQHLYRIEYATGRRQRLTAEPGWHDAEASADGTALLVRGSALDRPGSSDLHGPHGAARIASAFGREHPYRDYLDEHLTPELGTIEAADGQTLHYRLTRPKAATPVPLIVSVYGGPGAQRVRNEWPALTLQMLGQAGFGVLELDNRGTANRGRRFEAPIHLRLGHAEVQDQVAGARFAAGLDWVDAERIGVFGHSYGGYMALMCLCGAPDLFRAGVAVAPVADWRLYDTHYTERYLGMPAENAAGYATSAVLSHLEGLRGRLLLMHGMADDNVLFHHCTLLMDALHRLGVAFELMTYPGSKHSMQERHVSIHRYNLILDFFRRSL